jgi:hypothetical protein
VLLIGKDKTMKYQVLAYAETCGAETLYETDDYNTAKGWLVGYIRDGFGGWEEFLIQNSDGEPQSAFDDYGWTHY